ncbi:MAG: molybdopterin-synthase adenylyltransferase MoeB [Bacteroidota bacterium]
MSTNSTFSKDELKRYSRHILLPDFGKEGQTKLKKSKVLVVGAGGLGSPLLSYLTAAGVGTIGIIDYDLVELSNLQRQLLFTENDIGKPKLHVAVKKLKELNPHVNFVLYDDKLTSDNALEIIKEYDLVADGSDNFPTRYLVNDACVILDKPNVYASIYQFEGQVSVFNFFNNVGERGPNYRDFYPTPPPPDTVPNCAEGGVLGVLAGIVGSLQANEVIKLLTGIGTTLSGKLFIIDTLTLESRTIKLPKTTNAEEIRELIDYEEFCGINNSSPFDVNEVNVQEFDQMLKNGNDIELVDVRTEFEHHIENLGGKLIPIENLVNRIDEISRDKKVIVYCKIGVRSTEAILHLQNIYQFKNLYNLTGGIEAWKKEMGEALT